MRCPGYRWIQKPTTGARACLFTSNNCYSFTTPWAPSCNCIGSTCYCYAKKQPYGLKRDRGEAWGHEVMQMSSDFSSPFNHFSVRDTSRTTEKCLGLHIRCYLLFGPSCEDVWLLIISTKKMDDGSFSRLLLQALQNQSFPTGSRPPWLSSHETKLKFLILKNVCEGVQQTANYFIPTTFKGRHFWK